MYKILKSITFIFLISSLGCQTIENSCVYGSKHRIDKKTTMQRETSMMDKSEMMMQSTTTMKGEMVSGIRYYPSGRASSSVLMVEKLTPKEVPLHSDVEYMIRVKNLTTDSMMVRIEEQLDPTFSINRSTPTHTLSSDRTKAMWDLGKLKGKETREIKIMGKATKPGSFKNCALPEYDRYLCQSIKVINPQIALTKEMPSEARINEQIPVKLKISNTGSGTARNVVVTDTLPNRLNAVNSPERMLRFNVGDLDEGQSKTLQFLATSAHTGTYTNTAKAVADGNLSATAADATIIRKSQLSLTKDATERQYAGRNVDYTITVKNDGDALAKNVVITDPVPNTLSFLSGSDGARLVDNTIMWNIGNLRPGATRTVKARLKSSVMGTVSNTAYAKSEQAPQVSATDKTLLIGVPGILLEVIDSTDPLEVGDVGKYTITASNQGSAPGHDVRIVCEIEDNMEIISATGSTPGTVAGNSVTFSPVASLPAKQKAEWSIRIRAKTPGDVRFTTRMMSRELQRPVMETESTTIY